MGIELINPPHEALVRVRRVTGQSLCHRAGHGAGAGVGKCCFRSLNSSRWAFPERWADTRQHWLVYSPRQAKRWFYNPHYTDGGTEAWRDVHIPMTTVGAKSKASNHFVVFLQPPNPGGVFSITHSSTRTHVRSVLGLNCFLWKQSGHTYTCSYIILKSRLQPSGSCFEVCVNECRRIEWICPPRPPATPAGGGNDRSAITPGRLRVPALYARGDDLPPAL